MTGSHDTRAAGRLPAVAHVLWTGNVGGIERLVWDLARCQAAQGRRVGVLYGQARGEFFERASADESLETLGLDFRSGFDSRPSRTARAAAFLDSYDVVHLHAFNPPLMAAVRRSRRPVVCTLHGVARVGRGIKPGLIRVMRRRFLHAADSITANSTFCRDMNAQRFGLDASSIRVIPNGVPTPSSTGQPLETVARIREDGARLVAGVLCRLISWKRVERAVAAVAQIPAELGVTLVVAGDGPARDTLRQLADTTGAAARIHFLGNVQRVGDFLRDIDLLVHPAESEPFGLVLGEAALCGTPVVVFADAGGAVEVARWANGAVVDDLDELSALLERFALHGVPSEMQPDIQAVNERLSIDSMKTSFDAVYADVLSGAR